MRTLSNAKLYIVNIAIGCVLITTEFSNQFKLLEKYTNQKDVADIESEPEKFETFQQTNEANYTELQMKYNELQSLHKQMEDDYMKKDADFRLKQKELETFQQAHQAKQNLIKAQSPSFQNEYAICNFFGNNATGVDDAGFIPTTANIWSKNLKSILKASQHPMDKSFSEQTTLHNMLLDLAPSILQKGLKVRPKHEEITRILDIVEHRRLNPDTAAPLKILVMGGSVTEGVGCNQNGIKGRSCNWSVRLESFLNNILGFNGVQVTNIASGGTHTGQALQIIKYWMYPDDVLPTGPDIIIHAYGANDSNLGDLGDTADAMDRIKNLFKQCIERMNAFVKAVHTSHTCPPPIIFHLDDYVGGHSQGGILQDMAYNMVMTRVAGWYDNFAVSSADVVRMLIYPSTTEENHFSPAWNIKRGRDKYTENCHFGWPGHQMITWVWAYNFLDSLINYCDHQDAQLEYQSSKQQLGTERYSRITAKAQTFVTASTNKNNNTGVVPPPLLATMQLEKVSEAWETEATSQAEHCSNVDSGIPCNFKWTASPAGKTSNAGALTKYLKPFIEKEKSKNWRIEVDNSHGWSRKLGIAMDIDAVLQFKVPKLSTTAKVLTIQSLKSYGEKWDGSKIQVEVLVAKNETDNKEVFSTHIEGNHTSQTSVQYSTELQLLDPVPKDSDAIIKMTLVGGSTFKIMGMMLCNR